MASEFQLEHVAWQVAEPAKMAEWYVKQLGFSIRHRAGGAADAHFLEDKASGMLLEIYRSPDLAVPDYPEMHPLTNHLAVTAVNPEVARDQLIAAGACLVSDFPASKTGDRLAMLRDPWGFPLQLVARKKDLGFLRTLCIGPETLGPARSHPRLLAAGYMNPFPPLEPKNSEAPVPEFPTFKTIADALSNGPFDLALIAVPNHAKLIFSIEEQLLKAGIPIACTKLRAGDWGEIARLAALSKDCGTAYFCNDHYHRAPTFLTAASKLDALGKLQTVDFRCKLPESASGFSPWTKSYRHLLLEDLAYHHFSTLAFLTKELSMQDGWCRSRCLAADGTTRNDVQFLAQMQDGWVLNYSARWGSPGPDFTSWACEFHLEGDKGWIVVSREKLIVNGRLFAPEEMLPPVDWLNTVIDTMAGSGKANCLTSLQEFLPVAGVIVRGLEYLNKV